MNIITFMCVLWVYSGFCYKTKYMPEKQACSLIVTVVIVKLVPPGKKMASPPLTPPGFLMWFRNTIQETLTIFSYLHEVSQKFITFLFTISAEGEFPQQPSSTIHLANLLTHLTEFRSLIKLCGNIRSFHKTSACLSRNSDIRLIL